MCFVVVSFFSLAFVLDKSGAVDRLLQRCEPTGEYTVLQRPLKVAS